jgi:methyltransferase (TIGR00027 family)
MPRRSAAAKTAFGPMVIAAMEQDFPDGQRLIDDELAIRFLPMRMRLMAWLVGRSRVLRTWASTAIEHNKQSSGIWGAMVGRKRYVDDKLTEALQEGIGQVVILGAGLDTRAYRLATPRGVPAFEVDLPANIAYKRQRLRRVFDQPPERVTLIPADLETDDLTAALAAHGFQVEQPAVFVWEAVTQYLTEDGVRRTLASLAKTATGSRLVFTFVRKDFLEGVNFYSFEKGYRDFVVKQRLWCFGLDPAGVKDLLEEYGWAEREQVGPAEYATRYFQPAGRELIAMELERSVYAEKR